jgi:hypothetical protein
MDSPKQPVNASMTLRVDADPARKHRPRRPASEPTPEACSDHSHAERLVHKRDVSNGESRPSVAIASFVAYTTVSLPAVGRSAAAVRANWSAGTSPSRSRSSSGAVKPRWRI